MSRRDRCAITCESARNHPCFAKPTADGTTLLRVWAGVSAYAVPGAGEVMLGVALPLARSRSGGCVAHREPHAGEVFRYFPEALLHGQVVGLGAGSDKPRVAAQLARAVGAVILSAE